MARIAYFVHGRGRGHSMRARAAVPRLRAAGHRVRVYGGEVTARCLVDISSVKGTSLIEAPSGGPSSEEVSLQGATEGPLPQGMDADAAAVDYEFVPSVTPGPRLLRRAGRRGIGDLRRLRAFRPDVVVSDSDMPSVFAARAYGVPAISVGHGLLYRHCHLPSVAGWPHRSRLREAVNAGSASVGSARQIVVHFAPVTPRSTSVRLARPGLRAALRGPIEHAADALRRADGAVPTGDFLLTYLHPSPDLRALLLRLLRLGLPIVSFGDHPTVGGIQHHAPDPISFAAHLRRCRAVVCTAGNQLPAECALLNKPMLAVYRRGDHEQRMNALLLGESGLAIARRMDQVDGETLDALLQSAPHADACEALRDLPTAEEAIVEAVHELVGTAGA